MDTSAHPAPAPDPIAQRAFVARLTAALRADERIMAAWLIGSLARGVADAYSDIDTLLAVRDADLPALIDDWSTFLAAIATTVFAQRLGAPDRPTITAITPDWTRFDLTLHPATDSRPHTYGAVTLLFARDGFTPPAVPAAAPGRDAAPRLPAIVEEFIRVLGLLPVAIGRGEYLAGLTPVMLLRGHLIDLFLIANDAPRGGAKRLNPLLTAEQRRALERLPPLVPTRDAIIAGHLACARLFLPRARALMAQRGLPYPEAFEQATLAYLQRELEIAL